MNRPIKFRGKWLYGGKQWVYGGIVSDNEHTSITTYDAMYEVTPSSLGQFTGLIDRNGKEIYEGDLIRDEEFTYVVYWMEDVAAFMVEEYHSECDAPKIFLLSDFGRECEVIGNIHE